MKRELLFVMLLLMLGVSMHAQSSGQMDERFNDGTKMPYGWFGEGWKVDDGKAKAEATEDSGGFYLWLWGEPRHDAQHDAR